MYTSKNIDWEDILDSIFRQKCILLIGPLISLNKDGLPIHHLLARELLEQGDQRGEAMYYDNDQLFFFRENRNKRLFYRKIARTFKACGPNEIHRKLALIPFDVVISISPDNYLQQVMRELDLPHESHFYKMNVNPQPIEVPAKEKPLLYNLFGSVDDEDSMIFTHDDLFTFLFSVLGAKKLPKELKYELETASNFIFLGFDFECWYMKILMRLFDLQEERFYCYASENTSSLSRDNKTFYINNFKVNFVENNPAAFAEMLYQVCARHDPPLLRQTATGHKLSFKEIIRKMIGRGELAEALEKLEEYCTEQQLDQQLDEVYLQSGRLSKLQKQITKNLITNQEAERETSRITQAVLDITGSLQEKV